MRYSKLLQHSLILLNCAIFNFAFANEVPVINAYQYENATTVSQGKLTISQRSGQIEAQTKNQQNLNSQSKIQQLQEDIKTLTEKLELQADSLVKLQKLIERNQKQLKITYLTCRSNPKNILPEKNISHVIFSDQSAYESAYKKIIQKNYQDAMLKLGEIYYHNGQLNKAKNQFLQIMKLYPNTTVAQMAQNQLKNIPSSNN